MRTFVSIFLILLFASQAFSSFLLDTMYRLNTNYVAQTLCENKARPQLHCNGKCYLSKQIAKEGKEAAPLTGNKKESSNEVYFFPAKMPALLLTVHASNEIYPSLATLSLSSYHHSLLRPPQVSLV